MSFINFSDAEKVFVSVIDNQHKTLVETINKIHSSKMNNDKESIINNLNVLIENIETHFETEERLMKEFHYPGYISHKLEHDRFYNQIIISTDKFNKGEIDFSMDQLDSLKRWFFNHLDLNDKKCGAYLRSKGID